MSAATIFYIALNITSFCLAAYFCKRFNIEKAKQLPKEAEHHPEDCIQAAESIGKFLEQRAKLAGVNFSKDKQLHPNNKTAQKIFKGNSAQIIAVNRIVHRLGFELVVREKTKKIK